MPQPIVFNRLMLKTTSAGVLFRFSCKEKQKINAKIGWKNFFSFFLHPLTQRGCHQDTPAYKNTHLSYVIPQPADGQHAVLPHW